MSLSGLWDEFAASVKSGVAGLAKNTVGDVLQQANTDAEAFLATSKQALRRWGDLLAEGKITSEDFEFLVRGQSSLAKLLALQSLGVTQARLERFRTGLISLVVSSAFKTLGL